MSTFSQVKSKIKNELLPNGNSSILDTAVSNAIISSVKFYENHKFWFNEANTAIPSVAGSFEYSMASSIIAIDDIIINKNGSRYQTNQVNYKYLNHITDTDSGNGIPCTWSWYNNKLIFGDIPTEGSLTLSISFHRKFDVLPGSAGGSSTNAWLVEGEELIMARAEIEVLEKLMKNFEFATIIRRQEAEILDSLIKRSELTQISGDTVSYI